MEGEVCCSSAEEGGLRLDCDQDRRLQRAYYSALVPWKNAFEGGPEGGREEEREGKSI